MTTARETFGGVSLAVFGPLLIVRFDPGWTKEDFGRAMAPILAKAPRRFAVVSEIRKVKPAGALERKTMSEQLSRVEDEINERVIFSAVVTDSMLARGAIRAMMWLNPARYPLVVRDRLEPAIADCVARLEAAGIPLRPEEAREAAIFAKRLERDRASLAAEG